MGVAPDFTLQEKVQDIGQGILRPLGVEWSGVYPVGRSGGSGSWFGLFSFLLKSSRVG